MAESNFEKEFKNEMQIPCPKCTESMHMAAQRCPNCQYDFSADEVRQNIASKKTDPTGCIILTAVIGVVALIGFVIWPGGSQSSGENGSSAASMPDSGKEYGYKEAAKLLIRERLRDPDSAIFSDLSVYPERADRSTIICGYVNSKNGFGGMTGQQRFITGGTVMLEEQFTKEEMTIAWTRFCN